jgi:hypothetical protein
MKSALFQKNVTINIAEGEAQAMIQQNLAQTDSLKRVQDSQTEAYKLLKNELGLSNSDMMNFIKTKLLKNYDGKNLALNVESPENAIRHTLNLK